jgi:hypothetical protein
MQSVSEAEIVQGGQGMDARFRSGVTSAWLVASCLGATAAAQQVIERDTTLTGPRGRTIERSIRTERGPGFVDRQVEIKRPGETLIRDTRIFSPGPRPGFAPGPGPRFYGGRPIVENFFVQRPAVVAPVIGVPFFSLFVGGGGGGGGFGGGFGGGPVGPPPVAVPPSVPQPPPPVDPIADPLGRLKSLHSNSRRDGCLALGSLHDPRAVPALIERLEKDIEKEVRVAAAWALGEIGDPRGAVPLERAALLDKRHDVREAAKTAYDRLPKPGQEPPREPTSTRLPGYPAPTAQPTVVSTPSPMPASTPLARPGQKPVNDPGAPGNANDDLPPPPPVPPTTPTVPSTLPELGAPKPAGGTL